MFLFLESSQWSAAEYTDEELREAIRIRIENLEINNATEGIEKVYTFNSVRKVYSSNGFNQLWKKQKETDAFITLIGNAWTEGLECNDYHYQRLVHLQSQPVLSRQLQSEYDILLSDAFLLYASHLLSGKVDPVSIDADWHVVRREGDPLLLFTSAIRNSNYKSTIEEIIPSNPNYTALKEALALYRAIKNDGGWQLIDQAKTIESGMEDYRIPSIRARLILTGDLAENSGNSDLTYDSNLQNAVIKFQRRHGFKGDGKIDEPTVRMMNVPVDERIRQIELNMERWRWLPGAFSNYYVMVNIANYNLEIYKNGTREQSYRVIAGKPVRKTPVFTSKISYLVFNPNWTIPPTILNNDVLPEVRKSTEYLNNKNIRVLDANGKHLNPDSIDWKNPNVKSYIYRQDPGPNNALGAVKFMFPNSFNVYIHDTPSKELFSKSERAFSSGCIRVENPLTLAEYLLNDAGKWNGQAINNVVATNETQTVYLKEKPDVHILYMTSWASNGDVFFRKDIYERDLALYNALKESPRLDLPSGF
jgi:murein L,D-transpeptidase YcbB/YkuD